MGLPWDFHGTPIRLNVIPMGLPFSVRFPWDHVTRIKLLLDPMGLAWDSYGISMVPP